MYLYPLTKKNLFKHSYTYQVFIKYVLSPEDIFNIISIFTLFIEHLQSLFQETWNLLLSNNTLNFILTQLIDLTMFT